MYEWPVFRPLSDDIPTSARDSREAASLHTRHTLALAPQESDDLVVFSR
jgi:hypothetical protein